MACMDHVCLGCGRAEMNNKSGPAQWPCPTCGSEEYSSHFDEDPDHDYADQDDDYADQDDEDMP
jgi:predicted  nucleic acid-binding Zn-ribbon protein|tara:strand:- start:21488 stop:21679 length:192 start_codon:yes stop_codon:yes gene_type:complete